MRFIHFVVYEFDPLLEVFTFLLFRVNILEYGVQIGLLIYHRRYLGWSISR